MSSKPETHRQLSTNDHIQVGVWLSVKKYIEMEKKGLMSPETILKYRELFGDVIQNIEGLTPETYPVSFALIDFDAPHAVDQQYDIILHKNSEIMAHALFFQIEQDLLEYSQFSQLVENNGSRDGSRGVALLDPLPTIEAIALDRCTQYNELIKFLPIGESLDLQHNIDVKKDNMVDTPLWVCVPTSLLINTTASNSPSPHPDEFEMTFEKQRTLIADPAFSPKLLILADAMSPQEIPQYPLLFDQYGDGIFHGQATDAQPSIQPSLLCIKSPLSCGTGLSHAMVLTHNAHTTQTPMTFKPAPLFCSTHGSTAQKLPQGLHVLTQVPPHEKVFKVYVIGDHIDIEVRESIAINEMYYSQKQLTMKDIAYRAIISEAEELYYIHNIHGIQDTAEKESILANFKAKCAQILAKAEVDGNNEGTEVPNTLYFNSRYMQMHKYNNSSYFCRDNDDGLLNHENIADLKGYLSSILSGEKQPLLSLYPNSPESFAKIEQENKDFNKKYNKDEKITVKQVIQCTKDTSVSPLYLPSRDIFHHALYESSIADKSKEYKDHLQIGKLIKHLSSTPNTRNNTVPKLDPITPEFRKSVKDLITILQDKLNLTFFGIDLVQNKYTGALYLIDINYFPSYATMKDFATRVNNEIVHTYLNNVKP